MAIEQGFFVHINDLASRMQQQIAHHADGNSFHPEGACLMLAMASSLLYTGLGRVPSIEEYSRVFANTAAGYFDARSVKPRVNQPPDIDPADIIARWSKGRAVLLGPLNINPDQGWIIDYWAHEPALLLREIGIWNGWGNIAETHIVTGIIAAWVYKDNSNGHAVTIMPDDLVLPRDLRRLSKKNYRSERVRYQKEMSLVQNNQDGDLDISPPSREHVMVDLSMVGNNSLGNSAIVLVSGRDIVRYITEPDDEGGDKRSFYWVVASKRNS